LATLNGQFSLHAYTNKTDLDLPSKKLGSFCNIFEIFTYLFKLTSQ